MDQFLPKSERVSRELDLEGLEAPLNKQAVFGNENPIELEIGIGKGYFIQYAAAANPEHNFIGIEYARKYLNAARNRTEKRPIPNVRYVCGEAFSFMETFLTPASLATVHLYFPDPWPKKRHNKRRIFNQAFIQLVFKLLKPDGMLLIATDHQNYWEHMCEVLENQDLLIRCEQLPEPPPGAESLTNYEIKYIKEGRPIYRTGFKKPIS